MLSMLSNTHTHTHLTALCPGQPLPGSSGTRKVKPVWILLKQETVRGSVISWTICKPAPRSRQITMPSPHHSVFYRPDAIPAAQPTASKSWRQQHCRQVCSMLKYVVCSVTLSVISNLWLTWWCKLMTQSGKQIDWLKITYSQPSPNLALKVWFIHENKKNQ